jgi:exportin-7
MSNLQVWQDDVEMIRKSLTLLNELASGYSPLRAVRKLETTAALMQNHYVSGNNFSFLNHEKHRQSRSLYYQILSKLLFAEDDDGDVAFYEFMKPFEQRLDELSTLVTIEDFQQPRVQVNS